MFRVERGPVFVYSAFSLLVGLSYSWGVATFSTTAAAFFLDLASTCVTFLLSALPGFVLMTVVETRTRGDSRRERAAKLILATLVGAIIFGLPIASLIFRIEESFGLAPWEPRYAGSYSLVFLSFGGLLLLATASARRESEWDAAILADEVAHRTRSRKRDELRLRQLRKQIEPHFLVNALATVKELDRREPGAGRGLLRTLSDYLALALSADRMAQRTVHDELLLTEKYLEILAVRMGPRLRFEIDVPEELRRAAIPPLMLGTLVENAVKHGIAPREAGGTVRVEFRREGDDLVVRVIDDGVGFCGEAGTGIGLVNTRSRLSALFGERGRLDLRTNAGGGVTASIRLPLEPPR